MAIVSFNSTITINNDNIKGIEIIVTEKNKSVVFLTKELFINFEENSKYIKYLKLKKR